MNYQTLVIAGIGTIGSGLLRIGKGTLENFERLVAVDRCAKNLIPQTDLDLRYCQGDIQDGKFLEHLFRDIRLPALFVNLCSGVDNVRIRKILSQFNVAYIDSCASEIHQKVEYRFSRLMPYSLQKTDSAYPHWLCWGINPGLVEIISRRMLQSRVENEGPFEISIFEFDQLHAELNDSKLAVGWSPEALVEEVLRSPAFWVRNGRPMELCEPGTFKVMAFWGGEPVVARLVGHEDVWNIARLNGVDGAEFIYALTPQVMKEFESGPERALKRLEVPKADVPVSGMERLAVKVKAPRSCREETLLWAVDHAEVWRRYKVNAVQYQTGKSLLLAMALLQQTHYGRMPVNCCAADLPIDDRDWETFDSLMAALDIHWTDAGALGLRTAPYPKTFSAKSWEAG